jgi:integrase
MEAENVRRVKEAPDPQAVALLAPITLHEARHTCASLMIDSGASLLVIKTVMGHASIQMTVDQYGHLMPDSLDVTRAAVNAYLARAGGDRGLRAI